jgi:hypothetical protein
VLPLTPGSPIHHVVNRLGRGRTSVARLSAGCSPAELQAVTFPTADGAGGIRTPAERIKSPPCCRYTTTPRGTWARVPAFESGHRSPSFWYPVGMAGFEPALSWSLARRIPGLSYIPIGEVGRVALESTSAAFQAAATPSQLPTLFLGRAQRKGPVRVDTRPGRTTAFGDGRVSQP